MSNTTMSSTSTPSNPYAVGKEIVCYCTRCKMDLGHTIMAAVGGAPARVMCRTCKSEHNYKPKKGVSDPGATPKRSIPNRSGTAKERVVEKTVPIEVEWLRQMNANTNTLREYAANENFKVGDRIAHPTFGEGIVQKQIFPNKIEILFKSDLKTLIHSAS